MGTEQARDYGSGIDPVGKAFLRWGRENKKDKNSCFVPD